MKATFEATPDFIRQVLLEFFENAGHGVDEISFQIGTAQGLPGEELAIFKGAKVVCEVPERHLMKVNGQAMVVVPAPSTKSVDSTPVIPDMEDVTK